MIIASLLLPLLAAVGGPVPQSIYEAAGGEPFWDIEISEDRIIFRNEGERVFERVRMRTAGGGVRIWEGRRGGRTIKVEARPEPCTDEADITYADHVTVHVDDFEFSGCGGASVRPQED